MRLCFLILAALPVLAQNALYLDLSGSWRIQAGDDPRYAQPGLDDSRWRTQAIPAQDGLVSGGLRMYWLRRQVELPAGTDRTRLALTLGAIRDGYEIYVDGKLAATTGSFDALETAHLPQPHTFSLPPVAGPSLQLALRVHRNISLPHQWRLPDLGPYLLTYQGQMPIDPGVAQLQQKHVERSLGLVFGTILLAIACLCFLAWTAERGHRELLWFALAALTRASVEYLHLFQLSVEAQPVNRFGTTTLEIAITQLVWPLLGEFAIASLAPPRAAWWRTALLSSYGLTFFVILGIQFLYWPATLTGVILLTMILVCWYRRSSRLDSLEARWTAIAIGTLALFQVENYMRRLVGVANWIPISFPIGRYMVDRDQIMFTTLALVILVSVLRRTAADRRERQRLTSEFEAARVIQRLLLNQAHLREPGFTLDAVYAPAQEVGGDFYYVLDGQTILVGDVSGKGLKAAMIVSLAIGTLRGVTDHRPGPLLSALSRAVAGQMEGGFITCCCARLDSGGQLTIANAGHLSPYLDGAEVPVDTGLPLGLALDAEYEETTLTLQPGSCLTMLSDGVVEAENAQRELFGFDRTRDNSTKSAREIADAAKAWGQNDDITVVTVRRNA